MLASIETKRSALLVRRGEIQGHLEALDRALKAGRSRAIDSIDYEAVRGLRTARRHGQRPRPRSLSGNVRHCCSLCFIEGAVMIKESKNATPPRECGGADIHDADKIEAVSGS